FYAVAAAAVVQHAEQRVRLRRSRFEVLQRPEVGGMLARHGELLVEVVGDACSRREIEFAEAVEIRIQNGIHDQIEVAKARADDRAHLSREAPWLPMRRVVAELEVQAVEHRAVVGVGYDK